MRDHLSLAVVFALVFASMLSAQSGCRAPDDTSARIVHYVTSVLTDSSRASAQVRDTLGIARVQPESDHPHHGQSYVLQDRHLLRSFRGSDPQGAQSVCVFRRADQVCGPGSELQIRSMDTAHVPRSDVQAGSVAHGFLTSRRGGPARFAKSSPPVPLSPYAERGNDGTDCVSPLPKGEGIKGVRTRAKDLLVE